MTLAEYLEQTKWAQCELARRAGINSAQICRHLKHGKPLGRLAALEIARAMSEAYVRGDVKVLPLTLDELAPQFARRRAA